MTKPTSTIDLFRKLFFEKTKRSPRTPLPESIPSIVDFLAPSESLKFIWFGHSTLLLNLDGKIILIDPVFSEYAAPVPFLIKRFQKPVLSLDELPAIDIILISHDHYDHLDRETIEFFKKKSTGFIVPTGVGQRLEDWGIPVSRITELGLRNETTHNGLRFIAREAQHFSGRGLFDRNKTLWVSWVIEGRAEKIFYSGDSGYGNHFRLIGDELGPFDVTFLENGQYNDNWREVHMHPEETLQAFLDLNGKLLVPVHWGMFDLSTHHWNEPVTRTLKMAEDWELPYYAPRLGEIVTLASVPWQARWWTEAEAPRIITVPPLAEMHV